MPRKKIQDSKSNIQEEPKKKWQPDARWLTAGWVLLLLGGMGHMLPKQLQPLFEWATYGITVQMGLGVLSVLVALYYLLGDEN